MLHLGSLAHYLADSPLKAVKSTNVKHKTYVLYNPHIEVNLTNHFLHYLKRKRFGIYIFIRCANTITVEFICGRDR